MTELLAHLGLRVLGLFHWKYILVNPLLLITASRDGFGVIDGDTPDVA